MRRFFTKGWKAIALAVAIVLIPTVAFAAVGSFTSTNTTPAVTGSNSSPGASVSGVFGRGNGTGNSTRYGVLGTATGLNGTGVRGTGTKYGIFSNGPLGVAPGQTLSCSVCVTAGDLATGSVDASKLASGAVGPAALSSAAKDDVLESGQSVSGVFNVYDAAGGPTYYAFNFRRPLAAPIADVVNTLTAPDPTHCPASGSAAPGWLCIYPGNSVNIVTGEGIIVSTVNGVVYGFTGVTASLSENFGTYTVTAP